MHQVQGQAAGKPKDTTWIWAQLLLDPALSSGFIIENGELRVENILIILVDLAALALMGLIFVYLWLDKKRFHVERQFRAVEELFDEWMACAREIDGCGAAVDAYEKTRDVTKKYLAIGAVSEAAWGYETGRMKQLAAQLDVFLGVYHALAEEYNRRLNSRFTGRIARLLRFKKLPELKLETE